MKRVTTSAQKTVVMRKSAALQRLRDLLGEQEAVRFAATGNPDILVAELGDGSTLRIASFEKDAERSVAMIDHEGVDSSARERWHAHWRGSIDRIFR